MAKSSSRRRSSSPKGLADRMEIGALLIPEVAGLRRTTIESATARERLFPWRHRAFSSFLATRPRALAFLPASSAGSRPSA